MNPYYPQDYTTTSALDNRVSRIMKQVYFKMFLGLLVTAFVSWVIAFYQQNFLVFLVQNRWLYWGLLLAEILLVVGITGSLRKMNPQLASALFYTFAIVNGLALSLIFVAYSLPSIFKTFLITAGTFGAMSVYGYFTDRDLTKFGTFLYMALWGLIIAVVVNIFWANSALDWIISFAGVIIFIGLTAWDTQRIKTMALQTPDGAVPAIATLGALMLYLDFINLFLYLLRFFGNSRN